VHLASGRWQSFLTERMTLRSRISLALLVIVLILVAPAVYGLYTLWELRGIAQDLRARDAVSALVLGRLQTAFGEIEHWQRIYMALAGTSPEIREDALRRVESNIRRFESELERLREAEYETATLAARARWNELQPAIREEQRLVEAGDLDAAERYREETVNPAFTALDRAIDPIGIAITRAGEEQVQRAQALATRASTTTLFALAAALALTFLIAGWLTRSLLRPVHELRRGMSVVASGDFEPQVAIPTDRPDELGDLARSFDLMTKQLAELDRLKAEFISVASHELKTPLSVIKGYVSLLQEGIYGDVPQPQRKVLASVSEQSDRLGRLIQQLLDVSRFEAGGGRLDLRPIEIRDFLKELATSFEALAVQNDIHFRVETSDSLPRSIIGDPDRLNEVVGNLLSNAFKFTPREGSILLRADSVDSRIQIEVQDTGVGIPEDQIPKIFDKFYQVDNTAHPKSIGSGLGLAIAREIVEAHEGMIGAESSLGKGTTFRVTLPQRPGSPETA
jgi:signal transduction histidine kinase